MEQLLDEIRDEISEWEDEEIIALAARILDTVRERRKARLKMK